MGHGADEQGAESSLRTDFGHSAKLVSPPFPPGDILGEIDATNLCYHDQTRICQAQAPRYPKENSIVSFVFFCMVVPAESLTRRPITPSLPSSPSLPPSISLRGTLPGLPAFRLGFEASFLPGPGSSLPPSLCDPPSLSTVTSCVCVSPLPPPLPPPLLPCQVYVAVIWVSTATPPFS